MKACLTVFVLSVLLAGCYDEDCPDGTQAYGDCAGAMPYSKGQVIATIGAPVGFDSVQVRLYRGVVGNGKPIASATYGNGHRTLAWSESFDTYAVQAIYWRGNQSVEAIDGGSTSTSTKAQCSCNTYELKAADLDLELAAWP